MANPFYKTKKGSTNVRQTDIIKKFKSKGKLKFVKQSDQTKCLLVRNDKEEVVIQKDLKHE